MQWIAPRYYDKFFNPTVTKNKALTSKCEGLWILRKFIRTHRVLEIRLLNAYVPFVKCRFLVFSIFEIKVMLVLVV